MKSLRSIFLATLTLTLLASVLTAVVSSLHWPLVGDASLMHYVVFLMSKGLRPYKDIIDVNLPGSYLFERFAMHLFGTGALAWRLYDLALLALMTAAAMVIAIRSRLLASTSEKFFAGLFAGALFALIHMQDGLAQLGQRDLLIAALLLCSYAALFTAQSLGNTQLWQPFVALLLFAALMGATLTIKPSFLPLGILLLLLSMKRTASLGLPRSYHLGGGIIALLLPPLAAVLWLFRQGVLVAYRQILHDQLPFYARMNGRPLSYLIGHSTSPVMAVCILWLVLLAVLRPRLTLERIELLTGIAIAFLAYAAQDKGLPYQRYPFLALLIVLIGIDLLAGWTAPESRLHCPQIIAAIALAVACLLLAPQAARRVHSFLPAAPLQEALSDELAAFGPGLSGQVQCLDTFGGCINTLYDLGLVQSTGYLSDCFLFTARQGPATALYREQFLAAFTAARPRVIVLTDQLCFGEPGGFAELDRWPQLRDHLAAAYTLHNEWHSPINERWWARSEYPPRYRIYISKTPGSPQTVHPVH